MYLNDEPFAHCVDDRCAHAVQAAGDLVAPAAELAAGVEHRVHNLQRGPPGLGLNVHGDAPAVVGDGDGVAGVDGHGNMLAVARESLVNGVVHDLVDQMVQAGRRCGADIHTGALAHRLQAFQHLDLLRAVFLGYLGFIRHSCPPSEYNEYSCHCEPVRTLAWQSPG